MSISRLLLGAALAAAIPAAASFPSAAEAAIVQTFASRAAFTAAAGVANLSFAFAPAGTTLASATIGTLSVSALGGQLFGMSDILSTELDGDGLLFSFSSPIKAIGLFGGIADPSLAYVDGNLLVTAIGSGSTMLAASGGSAGYLGLISDTGFSALRVEIQSYDINATSAPFVTLMEQVDLGAPGGSSALPEPAAWAQMVAGFLAIGAMVRRRRTVRCKRDLIPAEALRAG